MANLPESSSFDAGVYQIETTDPVIGGPSGVTNAPLKNLANRTKYLKDHVDALESGATAAGKATKLATARNISLAGDLSGQASFDGTASVSISASVIQAATDQAGKVQLATPAEAIAASNSSKAVTPAGLANYLNTSKMGVVGQIAFFAMNAVPSGWLKCNGAALSRISYADLFAAIGTLYGAGDGSNTFNIPDLRGEFLRGFDDGRGIDGGRSFGSWQKGTLVGGYDDNTANFDSSRLLGPASVWGGDLVTYDNTPELKNNMAAYHQPNANDSLVMINPTTYTSCSAWLNITRPRNVAVLPCIKF